MPVLTAEDGDDFGYGAEAEMARITLRIPERLKAQIERTAQRQGISVNSWLVDAAAAALRLPTAGRRGPRRVTGFVAGMTADMARRPGRSEMTRCG